jgi:hypothetical protein
LFFTAGKSKAKVITECRNAIKTNNVNLLLKVIRTGEASWLNRFKNWIFWSDFFRFVAVVHIYVLTTMHMIEGICSLYFIEFKNFIFKIPDHREWHLDLHRHNLKIVPLGRNPQHWYHSQWMTKGPPQPV